MNHPLYIISTSIHILAAIIWVGGLMFMSLMLVPALRALGDPALMVRLIQAVGKRFRLVGWICLVTLVITGFLNLTARGLPHNVLINPEFWQSPFGETLAWKLWLFAGVIALSLFHEVVTGPRLQILRETNPGKAEIYRKAASWMGRITLVLSLGIILLAVMMVRGRPW